MNNTRRCAVTIVTGVLLLMLYVLIFSFSAQDAEHSGSLSQLVSEKCVEFMNSLAGGNWTAEFMENMAEYFEHPIRKLAHFAEYAYMAVLLYILWSAWMEQGRRLYTLVIIWVFVSAASDEFHQLFVPGRYGSLADVLLDTAGGVVGVLFCVGVYKTVTRQRKKQRSKDNF